VKILFASHGCDCSKKALDIIESYSSIINHSFEGRISEFPKYDIGISFLYTYKIPAEQLSKTWINFHPAPLPEYGGRNVAYHAIMNGSENFGATMHYMNEEFDRGDIIECQRFPIENTDTAGDLVDKSYKTLLTILRKHAANICSGELPKSFTQDDTVYYKKECINDFVEIDEFTKTKIRSLTVSPKYYAKININGKIYSITPEQ
jgi:methionyl-tRNA formyltransferase